ncbi:MAG: phospho-N-acetylmuramoyl-pentapeptide-transferase [Sphaerochaetaceae bacterium]
MIILQIASSFVLSALITWALVAILNRRKAYVTVKPELLVQNETKARTPFFGGLGFLLTITIGALVFTDAGKAEVYIPLFALWVFGLAGFADDVLKLSSDNGDGFTVKQKLASQVLSAVLVAFLIMWKAPEAASTRIMFGKEVNLSFWYVIPAAIYLVYYVNALNITDGVDGLSSCSTLPVLAVLAVIGYQSGIQCLALVAIGTLLGFLVFNHSPAKIFMGDVGSHSLGGMIAAMALMMKAELLIILAGVLFLLEFLSSLIQIASIRIRKKKVFAIAPLHHLLEYHGLKPWKIVLLFSSINVAGSIAAVLIWSL